MTVKRLDHFNIRASEPLVEELREFYCDVIGLSEGSRPPIDEPGYWLYAGELAVLHLSVGAADESPVSKVETTLNHVALECTDKSAFEQHLADRGIAYTNDRVPGTTVRQLFLKDPAGNGIELSFAGG
jgi:extradiol dioxygenase family protein